MEHLYFLAGCLVGKTAIVLPSLMVLYYCIAHAEPYPYPERGANDQKPATLARR